MVIFMCSWRRSRELEPERDERREWNGNNR